ncbi:cardiolipin synthase ClsB [Variovorax paradoxus]|uniref:cardiolipin synthase ClsB n=1 Tax=Variovorax paradoxus TaxID=34073 RepID=UPI0029C80DD9|nr:cardiolipin synthase ClsB [Variovorax paradoxus]
MKNAPTRGLARSRWVPGNRVSLLENGEEFFPRVFEAVEHAQHEVIIETFILYEDKVGTQLHACLCAAARRGVRVDLLIDGFGSPDLSGAFIEEMASAGVRLRVFDPGHSILGQRLNLLRRMHRKIVVVDDACAFVGGINFSADQLLDFGDTAKQDYAVELNGPIVQLIHRFAAHAVAAGKKAQAVRNHRPGPPEHQRASSGHARAGEAEVCLVTRDNWRHTNDIERHYRVAIRSARQRVVIANAYFFPGYRLVQDMRNAARRGVDVRLILQGEPDIPIVRVAARMLYHHLLLAGVSIFEYCERPMHAKVALTDDCWSTVGSSNLDPLSLALNLEANVVVHDPAFNRALFERLEHMNRSCKRIEAADLDKWSSWRLVRSFVVFHLLRWYPSWIAWLPRHAPRVTPLGR